jgi:hypothetical protein
MTVLKTAIATYPHTKGLKMALCRCQASSSNMSRLRRSSVLSATCAALDFDLCEMAITT